MTLVRPQAILAMTDESPAPRYLMSTTSMQLVRRGNVVWARKAGWFRNPPHTAAQLIKQRMTGYRAQFRIQDPSQYPSRLRHTMGGVVDRSINAGAADLRQIMQDKLRRSGMTGGRGAGPGALGAIVQAAQM